MKRMMFLMLVIASSVLLNREAFASDLHQMAEDAAEEYSICPEILEAMAFVESSNDPNAVNGECEGLLQVNTRLHREEMEELGISDIYDPEQAMRLGAGILYDLLMKNDGDMYVSLTAYNSGQYSKAVDAVNSGSLNGYAEKVMGLSEQLEREHEKEKR